MTLINIKEVDRRFYEERLKGFLPARILDVHTHIWLDRFRAHAAEEDSRVESWPSRVAKDSPIENLVETYREMLPGKSVTPMLFGNALSHQDDLEGCNAYVSASAAEHGYPALAFATPRWSGKELEDRVLAGGFLGVKVYLSLSDTYLPQKEIRIYDFLPPRQMEVLDRHGWIVMLHIPRDGRLRDPVNLAQMVDIDQQYPRAKVIIAHVGRAYCPEDVGNALEILSTTQHLSFDISANTNETVFRQLIEAVGPRRIVFGSDMPITRMRMRRVCEGGNYVNVIPRGLYGDVTGDRHMREVDGTEAERLTFFLYEELDAFRRAAKDTGLAKQDIEDVFWNNAIRIIENARTGKA